MSGTVPEPNGTRTGTRYSVPDAARLLGITERAVRKRIAAGTLRGETDGRRWWVLLATEPSSGTTAEPLEATYRVTPEQITQAIEATSARYVADMQTVFAEVGRLYQEQIEAKDQLVDELRRRAEAAEERADALAARLDALQARGGPETPSHDLGDLAGDSEATPAPWWQFWRRR